MIFFTKVSFCFTMDVAVRSDNEVRVNTIHTAIVRCVPDSVSDLCYSVIALNLTLLRTVG